MITMRRRITLDERAAQIGNVCQQLGIRMDANETALFSRQLESIEKRLFEVKYPDGHGVEIVPILSSIDPGASQYTYRAGDYTGKAKRVVNWATDFPRVDVQGKEVKQSLHNYGASYGFDLQQLRASKFAGYSLEQNLNVAARRVIMRELDINIWIGDSAVGITGIANNANVSPTAVITGDWPSATSAQVYADVQKLISQVRIQSKGIHKTNSVALPTSSMELLAQTILDTANASNATILEVLKKNNPGVGFFESYQLETAGNDGAGRALAFEADAENMEALVPTEFEILPAVSLGGSFEVKVMGRFGGVALRYPLALACMDDILAD
jgi:hypothetical protein